MSSSRLLFPLFSSCKISTRLFCPTLLFFLLQFSRVSGELFGEAFVSMKDAHSLLKNLSNFVSLRSETLKRHLEGCLWNCLLWRTKEIGAWSLIIIEWIDVSVLSRMSELLVWKKLMHENEWCSSEKYEYSYPYLFILLSILFMVSCLFSASCCWFFYCLFKNYNRII